MSGSIVDLGQGRIKKERLPEPITFPRRCACGYKLKPGESASYMLGRWVCIHCCVGERKNWGKNE